MILPFLILSVSSSAELFRTRFTTNENFSMEVSNRTAREPGRTQYLRRQCICYLQLILIASQPAHEICNVCWLGGARLVLETFVVRLDLLLVNANLELIWKSDVDTLVVSHQRRGGAVQHDTQTRVGFELIDDRGAQRERVTYGMPIRRHFCTVRVSGAVHRCR